MAVSLALREPQPMIEMNMTPLVDVLLVLIIMFIITVPIQSHAVKLDLPQGIALPTDGQRNLLTIAPDGVARWNGVKADDATLMATLRASQAMVPQPELHLRPDALARYERVDEVLAMTKRADITRMGFVGNEAYRRF
ncbi:MAG: biopolymer transporter ExbD [Sphingomicrobium sp.]